MHKSCFNDYIYRVENSISSNPKVFWSFIKTMKNSSTLPERTIYHGVVSDSKQDIVNSFSTYFKSVFETPVDSDLPDEIGPADISSITINAEIIHRIIKQLDLRKGAGSDRISPIFVNRCGKSLAYPLSIIFKRSLDEGIFPHEWKTAHITPIYKSGPKHDVENYRPISKLCIFSKIFEKLVYAQLHAAVKIYISDSQHGFQSGRSTTSNLILFTETLLTNMDQRYQTDAIYTDFSKAFDKVNHPTLISKLFKIGIHGDLLRWLKSYISKRSQIVVAAGFKSNRVSVTSGVPQGSILGPLLYTLYINDIDECFKHSKILLFADDMKAFMRISSMHDCLNFQEDLNRFSTYCELNHLQLNVHKCHSVRFTRKRDMIKHQYQLFNIDIHSKSVTKDLGILLDDKLQFIDHIDTITKKAFGMLGFILRTSKSLFNIHTIKTLFYAYVRPHLEYCSQVWNPLYAIHKNRIERIQTKFLKYLNYRSYLTLDNPYSINIHHSHNITTLADRRTYHDLVFLHKILNNKLNCMDLVQLIHFRTPSKTTRQSTLFHISRCNSNYSQNSFLNRVCRVYDDRYASIDIFAESNNGFRNLLKRAIFNN